METLQLLLYFGAAAAGGIVGAAACYWPLQRTIAELRSRLERSEHARSGAVERSAQAREQIAQLNRAITELRRTHSPVPKPAAARDALEKAMSEVDEKTLLLLRREAPPIFAATQVMDIER
jgi:biopolymer transport protein ExbB/TolQ